jgi:hypothetical protein
MHTTRRERAAGLESQVTSELMAGRLSAEDADLMVRLARDVREGTYLVRCAWCRRFCADGKWFDAPAGFSWSSELNESPTTHGICPECLAIAPRSDHERITPNR